MSHCVRKNTGAHSSALAVADLTVRTSLFVSTLSCSIFYQTCLEQCDDPPLGRLISRVSCSCWASADMRHNSADILQTHTDSILRDTSRVQPQLQRTGRALQQALSIPGNLCEPFIVVGRLPTHPLPSRPRWTSQRSALRYAALFDYVKLGGLFRGMFTYRLHYTLAWHNESGMSESIIRSTLGDLDGRWPPGEIIWMFLFCCLSRSKRAEKVSGFHEAAVRPLVFFQKKKKWWCKQESFLYTLLFSMTDQLHNQLMTFKQTWQLT